MQGGHKSNLTKRTHRRRTWTVHSYSPGSANVHFHLTRASLGHPSAHQSGAWTGSIRGWVGLGWVAKLQLFVG